MKKMKSIKKIIVSAMLSTLIAIPMAIGLTGTVTSNTNTIALNNQQNIKVNNDFSVDEIIEVEDDKDIDTIEINHSTRA